jgi:hypothetical protein
MERKIIMERKMKSKITILLLMSAFAIAATDAVGQTQRHHRHPVRFNDRAVAFDDQPEWYQKWLLNRLYHQPEGYVPDYRGCFPGACRDNPRY